MNNIKRTELEILDIAIFEAKQYGRLVAEVEKRKYKLNNMGYAEVKEIAFKKGDTKKLEEYYKEKLECQKSNLNHEKYLALDLARAEIRLEASNEKLELLRWLYKENPNE